MLTRTQKLAAWLVSTTRSAPPIVPPARLDPIPPEKSPPPHRMAAASAIIAFAPSIVPACSSLTYSG